MAGSRSAKPRLKQFKFPNIFNRGSSSSIVDTNAKASLASSATPATDGAHSIGTPDSHTSASHIADKVAQTPLSRQPTQFSNSGSAPLAYPSERYNETVSATRPYSDRTERPQIAEGHTVSDEDTTLEDGSLPDCVPDYFVSVEKPPSSEVIFRRTPVPSRIACRLAVVIDGCNARYHECFFKIRWQEGMDNELCFKRVQDYLVTQMYVGQDFYETSRQLRILEHIPKGESRPPSREAQVADSSSGAATSFHALDFLLRRNLQERQLHAEDIRDRQAWREILPQKLVQYFSERRDARIFVELKLAYTTFYRHTCDEKQDCRKAVTLALKGKRVYNEVDHHVWFIPQNFLDEYFKKWLIKHLIEVDARAYEGYDWRESGEDSVDDLVSGTALFGLRLFAICIYAEVDLDRFFLMWNKGLRDTDLPMDRQLIDGLIGPDSVRSNDFRTAQGKFRAHKFPPRRLPHKHESIQDTIVLPFTFKREHDTQGANGKVYKVQIHEDHHNFLPDRSQFLAVKQLRVVDTHASGFSGEIISGQALSAVSHRHLTPLLASWSYQGAFHMLFPWAECSLLYLLEDEPSPPLRDNLVEWFLKQTAGLAAALDQIHNLKRPELENQAQHTGWHHDLKPSNILLFSDGMLKISDFGTAQIRQRTSSDFRKNQSPKAQHPVGDWDYDAPDYELHKSISRPYDIFALGCIFVEMLSWLFGKGGQQLKDFKDQRRLEAEQTPATLDAARDQCKSANFWHRVKFDCYELKFVVVKEIKELNERAKDKWVLRWLVMLIERMLTIDCLERPISALVSSELYHLHQQAVIDIRNNQLNNETLQDFFTLAAAPGSKVFGPPSSPGRGTRSASNRYSRIQDAPAIGEVLQSPATLRRSNLPSTNLESTVGPSSQDRASLIPGTRRHDEIVSSGKQFEEVPIDQGLPDVLDPGKTITETSSRASSQGIYVDATETIQRSPARQRRR